MTEIRRVLVVEPYEGARWRSITAYSLSLQELIRTAGIEVEVASAPWFNPPSLVGATRARWWNQPAIKDAARGKFDLVHLTDHALGHHAARFARSAATIVTCHDLMPLTVPGYYASGREALIKKTFLRRPYGALRHANAVVCVSQFTADELQQRYALGGTTRVVPNVVRPAFKKTARPEAEQALAKLGAALPAGPRVLSVGNDRAYKNLPALVEAMAQPALAHASIVRVGSPFTGEAAVLASRLHVERRTHFVIAASDETLALVYSACSVLAQPSLGEGFGIPVIEAMACRLPVVASDGGALAEVIGGGGRVVSLNGGEFPLRFGRALAEAIDHPDRLANDAAARAQDFQPAAVLPRLLEAYEFALGRHR